MSIKIFLLKTHKINLTNIVVAQLIKNAGQQCYSPCEYSLSDKFIDITLGEFAKSQHSVTDQQVRYIDWTAHIDKLEASVALATQQNKFLIFGTHDPHQLNFLKNYFGESIFTISVNYQPNSFSLLIKNMSEYHVHLLKLNSLPITEIDQKLLESSTDQQLISHYQFEFSNLKLIPQSSITKADYSIPVDDLFNKSSMSDHFINIGLPFTQKSESYYDSWLSLQSTT